MIYVFEKNYDVPVSEMIDIPYSYTCICLFAHVYFYFERIPIYTAKTIIWKGSYWSFKKISKIQMCHVNRTESPFYLNLRLWYFIVVWILLFWIEKDHILLLDFHFFFKFLLYIFCCQIKLPKHKSNYHTHSDFHWFFFLYEYSLRDISVIINFHWDIIL